jgi:sensor histidine kinase YesM
VEIADDILPHVQSEEFDGLIDKINELLFNLNKRNDELRIAEIEKQKAIIFSLKKQINAHFTINTLNTIRIHAEQGDFEKAESVSMGLTSLIRYAHDKDELINILDELDILENYVGIMNSRYDEKIMADFAFDDRLMNYRMPRMLLQPIIENCIVHGFKDMDCGCVISLRAGLHDGAIVFRVSDNGCGMNGEEFAVLHDKLNTGTVTAGGLDNIALLNIKNRLHHYYGGEGRLEIRQGESGGITVTVAMPPAHRAEGTA